MKRGIKYLLIFIWILFVNGSDLVDSYVVFYIDGTTVNKCKREDYLEYKELIEETDFIKNDRLDLNFYYAFEKDYQKQFATIIKTETDYGKLEEIKKNYERRLSKLDSTKVR